MSNATIIAFAKDVSIADRVRICLYEPGYPQLNQLTCESNGSTVVLKGELSSFYLAQLALSIATKVKGVQRVVNKVKVFE